MKKIILLLCICNFILNGQDVWINEIDADQTSTDNDEFIELVGISGLDITNYELVLYNGNDTSGVNDYSTNVISSFTFTDELNGYGFFVIGSNNIVVRDQVLGSGGSNLIQNGSPDGIALFDASINLVFQYSYGGTFTGTKSGYPTVNFSPSRSAVDNAVTSMGFLLNSKPLLTDLGVSNLNPTPGVANSDGTNTQTLPVELSSFSASVLENGVKLNWRTETEVSNYGFEILRSAQDDEWDVLGFVEGHGNSNSPKEYSFIDENISGGKYSYRLKQIDNDGKFEYSKIVEVDIGTPLNFEFSQNYPNPFNPSTTINFSLPENEFVNLSVYNVLGEKVAILLNEYKEAGVYSINFNADKLNSGIYIYTIEAGDFVQSRKMIFLK